MSLPGKCDFCEERIEEGQGFVCKCSFMYAVCGRCALRMMTCPLCDMTYVSAAFAKSNKKIT